MKRIFSEKDLAKLIFPLVIELMLTLLVGMIDSVMVSSAGEAAVSGVSLVDTVFQLLIYIFSAFGTGGAVAVAAGQYLGAGQKDHAKETAKQLVWFSALSSIVIMGLVYLIRGFLLGHVYGAIMQEVHWNANRYLMIVGLSIPALSIYESGAAIFRTMGNSKVGETDRKIVLFVELSRSVLWKPHFPCRQTAMKTSGRQVEVHPFLCYIERGASESNTVKYEA